MAAVIVHGGAYSIPDSIAVASARGCERAAQEAHKALLSGKSAVDAGKWLLVLYLHLVRFVLCVCTCTCTCLVLVCLIVSHSHALMI